MMNKYINKILFKAYIFFIISILFFSTSLNAAMRDRVIVKDSNVFTDTYQPLRCSHVFLYEGTIETINSKERWQETEDYLNILINEYGFNCIRIGVWNWQLENAVHKGYSAVNNAAQEHVQNYIDFASRAGIYIMLNLHSPYGTPYRENYEVTSNNNNKEKIINTLKNAKEFWSVYGKKYKNNTHVIFELMNEPKVDASDFPNMVNLYHHLRKIAPKTHIIAWSFNITSKMDLSILKQYSGKDNKKIHYDNASVGFHNYENNGLSAWQDAQDWQQAGFPVICTEFQSYQDYTLEGSADLPHYLSGVNSAERLGIGWAGWVYEASIQAKHLKKGRLYPRNFLNLASEFGIPIKGIEIDNRPQQKGTEPTVNLILENTTYNQAAIPLTVKAKNTVAVYYYSGNTLIGFSHAAPKFNFIWENPPLGDHKLSARAVSKKGVYFRSSPKHILISNTKGYVLAEQSFENGLQGWLGQRASAVISNTQAHTGQYSLRYQQPGNSEEKIASLSKDRGVVLNIKQELSAFGQGKYAISFWIKSSKKDQTLKIKTRFNEKKDTLASVVATPNEWHLFEDNVHLHWEEDDLKLGFLSIESPEQQDFFIDDVNIKKMSAITPMTVEHNF